MLIRARIIVLLLICALPRGLGALNVYVNETLYETYVPAEVRAISYQKATPPAGIGVTVDELFPPMITAYELHASPPGETPVTQFEVSADRLHEIWILIGTGDSADAQLVIPSKPVLEVESIRLFGEISPSSRLASRAVEDARQGRTGRREPDLDVWIGWEGTDELKAEIAEYARMHDLVIEVNEVPSADSKLLSVVRARGPVPDLVMVSAGSIYPLSTARAIQPLPPESLAGLSENAQRAFELDGRIWARPFYLDVQLMFANPELLRLPAGGPEADGTGAETAGTAPQAGRNTSAPSATGEGKTAGTGSADQTSPSRVSLEELEAALEDTAEAKTSEEVHPACWNAYSAYWLAPFQSGFGHEAIVDGDGRITIYDQPTRSAIQYIVDLKNRGLLEIAERDVMISKFVAGNVGLMLSGSYTIPLLEELDVPFEVFAYPQNEHNGRPISPMLDYKGFAVTRTSDSPILARRLIEHLCGPGVQQRFSVELAKIPIDEEARWVWAESNRYAEQMIASESIGMPVPVGPSYGIYKNSLWKILRFIYSGRLTIDEALAEGQRVIDERVDSLKKQEEYR